MATTPAPDLFAPKPPPAPEENGWDVPLPLEATDLPPFPTEALPDWGRAAVEDVADAIQVPVDLPAVVFLAVIAVAVARRVVLEVEEGFRVPLNVWTFCPLPPGNRKSLTVEILTAPLEAWEADRKRRLGPVLAQAQSRRRIKDAALQKLEGAAARASEDNERLRLTAEAVSLASDLAVEWVDEPPQLLAGDTTPEALALLLYEQQGRIAIILPEGGIFDTIAGRYNSGVPNLDNFNDAFVGDPIRVKRRGRPADFVLKPALTLAICPQPEVLEDMTAKRGFRGRGFLARFLFALPESMVGYRKRTRKRAPSIRQEYERRVAALLEIDQHTERADGDGTGGDARDEGQRIPAPYVVACTPEAADLRARFEEELEPRLRPLGDLYAIRDWASKLAGTLTRVAGLLHIARYAHVSEHGGWAWLTEPLSVETMADALGLADYFIPHARAAFQRMHLDPAHDDARHLLGWFLRDGIATFTRHDCWVGTRGHFELADDIDKPLEVLARHGYIRPRITSDSTSDHHANDRGRGRPKGHQWEVNPLWIESQVFLGIFGNRFQRAGLKNGGGPDPHFATPTDVEPAAGKKSNTLETVPKNTQKSPHATGGAPGEVSGCPNDDEVV